ncbi:Nucleotidyl transferase AbiEii toxin, Type IV TA system [Flavobacterium micromati]|uniref:Nucleotidyl transferase AbiEii toxin, Type IV TA system n=1 Tax=Flavobacterium micromati TaxID=229205 RepID=A0A1M5K878_9FLAO|nr:nucleotidyl transferase AbiEii/AbiGii toxin family protein [Flavobacterium micromati]SHG49034.1 Nucleotidyl transferase AbiEii toxin, Type IV TA system [Flavobacterium micromati]
MTDFIHKDPEFKDLLAIVSAQRGIDITLIEKDYWIMHSLYSLQQQGIDFELKGGTSLSKGYGLIHRFSEDIDIHIRTNFGLVIEGKEAKRQVIAARKQFYDVLAGTITIDGIVRVERDYEFDDTDKYRSGGIRLHYKSYTPTMDGLKDGILLEAGFDTVAPNTPLPISSWIWDHLVSMNLQSKYIDNTAPSVLCYHPGFTLVEKLQTIIRKYRNRKNTGESNDKNFMRQYYDVYCLLGNQDILRFIGTPKYSEHKAARIRGADSTIPIAENQAFLLDDRQIRDSFEMRYSATSTLYYNGQPAFDEVIGRIQCFLTIL